MAFVMKRRSFIIGAGSAGALLCAPAIVRAGSSNPPAPLKPFVNGQRSLAFFGDSLTALGFTISGNNVLKGLTGYTCWVNNLSRQRFYTPDGMNFGVSGDTSAQMVARLSPVVAAQPNICSVWVGGNDLSGSVSFASLTGNLNTIYNALAAIGCTVVAIPIIARNAANAWTAAQQLVGMQVNEWIRRQAAARKGFVVVDCGSVYDDPTSATWVPYAAYTDDGIHTNPLGAYVIATRAVSELTALYPDYYIPVSTAVDVYDATNNPTGNLLPGGMFLGTGGTTGSPATGTTATGWATVATSLLGATCAMSKSTMADGRIAQQIDLSGTYTGSLGFLTMNGTMTNANFAAGDVIEGCLEFSIAASSAAIASIDAYIQSTEGGVTYTCHAANPKTTSTGIVTAAYSGILKTPQRTITAQPNGIFLVIRVSFFDPGSSTPIAATIKLASAEVRKI